MRLTSDTVHKQLYAGTRVSVCYSLWRTVSFSVIGGGGCFDIICEDLGQWLQEEITTTA